MHAVDEFQQFPAHDRKLKAAAAAHNATAVKQATATGGASTCDSCTRITGRVVRVSRLLQARYHVTKSVWWGPATTCMHASRAARRIVRSAAHACKNAVAAVDSAGAACAALSSAESLAPDDILTLRA